MTHKTTNKLINLQTNYIQIQKHSISIKNKHQNIYIHLIYNQVSSKSHNKQQTNNTSIVKSLKLLSPFLYLSYF